MCTRARRRARLSRSARALTPRAPRRAAPWLVRQHLRGSRSPPRRQRARSSSSASRTRAHERGTAYEDVEARSPMATQLHFSPRPNRASEIDWREWGPAAFAQAAEEHKPVLLAISAVWCHWCHVMDETSYSDPDVIG